MTMPIVEYLTDKPNMKENETQTDLLLNKPSVSKKKAQKHLILAENEAGDRVWMNAEPDRSVATQIVLEDNLYDFNKEVEPVLSVLITKTLEQARMEVLEEEELRIMKEQKKKFEQKKVSELAEVQRYEASEKRLEQENTRRKAQSQLIHEQQVAVHKQLCARMVSKGFLRSLMKNSLDIVEQIGFFEEEKSTQLHSHFMPWLYDEVCYRLDKYNDYAFSITRMIDTVEEFHADTHGQSLNNNLRKLDKAKTAQHQKEQNKIAKRQRKIDERARQAEENRVNDLKTYVTSYFGRFDALRDKILTISDTNGLVDAKNRQLACLPGSILLELYCAAETLRRISEMEEFKAIIPPLTPKMMRSLLKNMLEYRQSKDCDWKFEVGYKFDHVMFLTNYQTQINPEEKKDEYEAVEKLKSLNTPMEVLQQLKALGNEQLLMDFSSEFFSTLTFFLNELFYHEHPTEAKPKIKLPTAVPEEDPAANVTSVASKPEEKKTDSKHSMQHDAEVDFANASIETDFTKFQPSIVNLVNEGIMRYILQEEREKCRHHLP